MDNVVHPKHYNHGNRFEAWDVIYDWRLDFDLGNVLKYISRAGQKPGSDEIEDLEKARAYLTHAIEQRRQHDRNHND